MITRQQALTGDRFHEDHEPAGKIYEWRRNGAPKTWKTRPDEFRVPVKYGLRSYDYITDTNADRFHLASECPTRHVRVADPDGGEFFGIVTVPGDLLTTVRVTTRSTSRRRVGSDVDVPGDAVSDL